MIKRIKKIQQVGTFRNFITGGPINFLRFTVVFGFNTQGKSTLCAIFDSLCKNDPSIILARESIPSDLAINNQHIEITYDDSGTEKTLIFDKTTGWNNDDLCNKLFIFDGDFVNRNIITGTQVTRENKECFTDFILGEEGVRLSNEIDTSKKEIRERRSSLGTKKPPFLYAEEDEDKIKEFIGLRVTESKKLLEDKKRDLEVKQSGLRESKSIVALSDLKIEEFSLKNNLSSLVSTINPILVETHEKITKATVEKIEEHLKNHNLVDNNGFDWLRKGIGFQNKDECPFCGQQYSSEQVKKLIIAYGDFFGEEYEKYAENLKTRLGEFSDKLESLFDIDSSMLEAEALRAYDYEKYIPEIGELLARFKKEVAKTKLIEKSTTIVLKTFIEEVKLVIENKNKQPHAKSKEISVPENLTTHVDKCLVAYNENKQIIEDVEKKIKALKKEAEGKNEDERLKLLIEYQQEMDTNKKKISRIEQDVECETYKKELEEIEKEVVAVEKKALKLETDQSEYLKKYFVELNRIYGLLGSSDFELVLDNTGRGDKKVYQLSLKYNNVEISSDKFAIVLSESDKRGLAFAIFLTKLANISTPEKAIIILDDPVVSFDDNRIRSAVDEIKRLAQEHAQVIVLTHYASLIKNLDRVRADANYLALDKSKSTSIIKDLNIDSFVLSPYQLAFEQIHLFIQGEYSINISEKCRVYMEEYLKFRYIKELKENGVATKGMMLGDLITNLKDKGIIIDSEKTKLWRLNEGLSPDHHLLPDGNLDPQDMANYAKELLETLHSLN